MSGAVVKAASLESRSCKENQGPNFENMCLEVFLVHFSLRVQKGGL